MAQLGSAFPWGGKGRTFESCRPDQFPTRKFLAGFDGSSLFGAVHWPGPASAVYRENLVESA